MNAASRSGVGWRQRTKTDGGRRSPKARLLTVAIGVFIVASLGSVRPAAAGILDSHVTDFRASPSYINLNFTTSVSVTIGTSYGVGLDNYRVTVIAPDATSSSVWFNFTGVGTMNATYGDSGAGFMAVVDQVGTYAVWLEHWDGSAFAVAASAEFRATNALRVVLLLRASSDPFTELHNCPVANTFVRGAKFLGGGYVYYESTGALVTAANSDATGNITGSFLGVTYVLVGPPLWHKGWKIPWDVPSGTHKFYLNASDGRGNYGSTESGIAPSRNIVIGPDTLQVTSTLLNGTGVERVSFAPGETIRLEVDVRYNDKNARESVADPTPADPFNGPLTPGVTGRGGVVSAHFGWGDFNATTSTFENLLVNLTLDYDPVREMWFATYVIPTSTANLTSVQAAISASDRATAPNTGSAFTTQFAIQRAPAPKVVEVEVPVTVEKSTGFEMPVVAGLAAVLLIVGLGVGMVVSRSRGRKTEQSPPPSGKVE